MACDLESLFRDLGVDAKTYGHKHCRPDWINTPCPFCTGNPGYHLGFSLSRNACVCWRCGNHSQPFAIAKLINLPLAKVQVLIKQYGGREWALPPVNHTNTLPFKEPCGIGRFSQRQAQYLIGRGFAPNHLESVWGIQGAGVSAMLDNHDYSHRIYVPIFWQGEQVSFQTRTVHRNVEPKYKACPREYERIQHQHILYGKEEVWDGFGICVEGVFDVWALGAQYAFAVFGIEYTQQQIMEIKRHFHTVLILLDSDPQAKVQAQKLEAELKFRGVNAQWVPIPEGKDPATLTKAELHYYRKLLDNLRITK